MSLNAHEFHQGMIAIQQMLEAALRDKHPIVEAVVERFKELTTKVEQQIHKPEKIEPYGTLMIYGAPAGQSLRCMWNSSAIDPRTSADRMTAFLMFDEAFGVRGVPVRHKIGSLWVTSQVPPQLTEKERIYDDSVNAMLHKKTRELIDFAESQRKVVTINLVPKPFHYAMGATYMHYNIRDNLALAREKAAQPTKIVRGSNYDSEMFFEKFFNDGEVFEREAARLKCIELNDDPKRDDAIYWRVEDADYKLYEFEP